MSDLFLNNRFIHSIHEIIHSMDTKQTSSTDKIFQKFQTVKSHKTTWTQTLKLPNIHRDKKYTMVVRQIIFVGNSLNPVEITCEQLTPNVLAIANGATNVSPNIWHSGLLLPDKNELTFCVETLDGSTVPDGMLTMLCEFVWG